MRLAQVAAIEDHPDGGLVTDDLRLIRLHEAARKIKSKILSGEESDWGPSSPIGNPPMPPAEWAQTLATRPGRKGREERDYAEVAARYVDALGSRTPIKELAEQLFLSDSQVRSVLNKARDRGLLTAAPKGKAGGKLTDKALKILKREA